jgi:uncharacterized protein YyaL (SSP411 family)
MRSLESFAPKIKAQPTMAPQMLAALGRSLAAPEQIVLRCDTECRDLFERESRSFSPNTVVLALSDAAARALSSLCPFLGGLERKGKISIYRCRNFTCELPEVVSP